MTVWECPSIHVLVPNTMESIHAARYPITPGLFLNQFTVTNSRQRYHHHGQWVCTYIT